ncbi:MAG: DUF4339 domain-containing protein [Mangrovibacterium sp.]
MDKYFYTDGNQQYGPFSKEELCLQNISQETLVWCYGMTDWKALTDVPAFSEVINAIPSCSKSEKTDKERTLSKEGNITETCISLEEKKRKAFVKWLFIAGAILVCLSCVVNWLIRVDTSIEEYQTVVDNSYVSNEDFEFYVEKFYRDLEMYGIFPPKPSVKIIKFSKIDELKDVTHIHGLSYGYNDDSRIEIYINPTSWKSFNKQMRYFLMYHELAHDVLNLDDLDPIESNEGKLMYPHLSKYEGKTMDDFIESSHALFEELE